MDFGFCLLQCGSSPSILTRQHGRLGRNVNAKKFEVSSVESHSMPVGHKAGVVAPSHLKWLFLFLFFSLFVQMWHSFILNHKYHPLYNTPTIIHACSYLIMKDFLTLLNLEKKFKKDSYCKHDVRKISTNFCLDSAEINLFWLYYNLMNYG